MTEDVSWRIAIQAALERSVDDRLLAGALAVIWHDGGVVLSAMAGDRDITRGIAMGRDAIFEIASMTKPIVSVAALQLVEEGKLRLDDPIARWLPEFANPRVLDDRTGPLERTHPAPRPIIVDDLLTHRAGFGYAFAEKGPIALALERTLGNVLHSRLGPDEWLRALSSLPLIADPGARFIYSHATEVLGCLIARIDGGTLGESLQKRVLAPLGMRDTAFYVPAEKRGRLMHMYRRSNGSFADVTDAPSASPLFEAGGGGLYSTADDYLIFARMLLGKGEVDGIRVLGTAMCERMMQNQLSDHQRTLEALGQPDFFAHSGFGYGVQVVLQPSPPLFSGVGSASWGGIFGTGWRNDPVNRLITLFFTQDFADTSSGPERREPSEVTVAARLQSEIEELAYGGLVHR